MPLLEERFQTHVGAEHGATVQTIHPLGLKAHPRNKSNMDCVYRGSRGFVGATMFRPFLPKGSASSVDDLCRGRWLRDQFDRRHVRWHRL
jgi:hypothetical protein